MLMRCDAYSYPSLAVNDGRIVQKEADHAATTPLAGHVQRRYRILLYITGRANIYTVNTRWNCCSNRCADWIHVAMVAATVAATIASCIQSSLSVATTGCTDWIHSAIVTATVEATIAVCNQSVQQLPQPVGQTEHTLQYNNAASVNRCIKCFIIAITNKRSKQQ